jgi:asparagine synthase (glutamine-hydrolysing)
MCGIVGYLGNKFNINKDLVHNSIYHRGPDESGYKIFPEVDLYLGMQRLAIIDLKSGKQPISNEDGTVCVVCNGEIFNYQFLRDDLLNKGHKFKSVNSDIEVLVHLYEEYGVKMLDHINGMFAFVIYDSKKKILFGARDRVGLKPLYYHFDSQGLIFSSELKTFKTISSVNLSLDYTSLSDYLSFQYIPSPNTIFNEIKKVDAGNYFIYDIEQKNFYSKKYWELTFNKLNMVTNEMVRDQFFNSVSLWSKADVPISISLSSGIDSTLLLGILNELGLNNITAYTLGFNSDNNNYNENKSSELLASKYNMSHKNIFIDANDILIDYEEMIYSLDEPYSGGFPSWYIYKEIKKDFKVVLTGTGGDELFGNYNKINYFKRGKLINFLKAIINSGNFNISNIRNDNFSYIYPLYFSESAKKNFLNDYVKKHLTHSTYDLIKSKIPINKNFTIDQKISYFDISNQLPDEFLHVTDRFSMYHSVEARTPFLDHNLIEMIYSLPVLNRKDKSYLNEIFPNIISKSRIKENKKGFTIPIEKWLFHDLLPQNEYYFSKSFINDQNIFCFNELSKIRASANSGNIECINKLWNIYNFQMWYKINFNL